MAWTVGLSLLAAFLDALSNVLEQSEAERVSDDHTLRPTLLIRLARRRRWLLGFTSDVGGYIVSAGALAIGAVVFVEPILSTGLLFSLFLGAAIERRHVPTAGWRAAVVLCVGLSVFLYETSPTGGRNLASVASWTLAAPCVVLAMAACVALASGASGTTRGALLGVASAISFAAGALLTKAFVYYLGNGVFAWVPHWEPYAMAVAHLGGFLLVQSAFQAGSLAASVAGIQATQPIVAVLLGVTMLHERIAVDGSASVFAVAMACIAVVWAVVVLARVEQPSTSGTTPPGGLPLDPT
ncbi:MAG: DMT family transporter [Acidimicrobiia bacterium]